MGIEDKKVRERRILDSVYARREPHMVVPDERPDFRITLRPGLLPFGVEVVELFGSESEARLARIPSYLDELMHEHHFRHKDDMGALSPVIGEIWSSSGRLKATNVKLVMHKTPSIVETVRKAAAVIKTKDGKHSDADGKLAHVNLAICDRTQIFGRLKPAEFSARFCVPELRDAVFESRFREIFYITKLTGHWSYVPLKLLLTMAELRYFDSVTEKPLLIGPSRIGGVFLRRFALHLAGIVADQVRLRCASGETEVLYGDCGFLVNSKSDIDVRMYEDGPLPAGMAVADGVSSDLGLTRLQEAIRGFMQENAFSMDLSFTADLHDEPASRGRLSLTPIDGPPDFGGRQGQSPAGDSGDSK